MTFPINCVACQISRYIITYHLFCFENFQRRKQSINRRRTDPLVTLGTLLESILSGIRKIPYVSSSNRVIMDGAGVGAGG